MSLAVANVAQGALIHDEESGLVYNRARYLSPTLGRPLQRDPLIYADSLSLYQYVLDNPTENVDPTGMRHRSISIDLAPDPTDLDHDYEPWGTYFASSDADATNYVTGLDAKYGKFDSNSGLFDCTWCYSDVTISCHGGNGQIALDGRDDLTPLSFIQYFKEERNPKGKKVNQAGIKFLEAIRARLCKGASVRIVSCHSASLLNQLQMFFGPDVNLGLYEEEVAWSIWGPKMVPPGSKAGKGGIHPG